MKVRKCCPTTRGTEHRPDCRYGTANRCPFCKREGPPLACSEPECVRRRAKLADEPDERLDLLTSRWPAAVRRALREAGTGRAKAGGGYQIFRERKTRGG